MKNKRKVSIVVLTCIILIGLVGYLTVKNPIILINNQKLANAIRSVDTQTVYLNNIVPFEWDKLYALKAYSSKEEIEDMIGFKSADIKENNINESMVHLLFVKGSKVVASVLGYDSNLGYTMNFADKDGRQITFEENPLFEVTSAEDIVRLTYTK
ncbi:MAG: hypothetical protein RR058_08450 [Oscillospiraceae bacterium]